MLNRLVPRQADNRYRGSRIALWLFGVVILLRAVMSLNSIFNGRVVATTADGIPLDSFTPDGAQTVLSLFALLALSHLMICLVGIVVLARYRTLVPLMFVLLLLHYAGRTAIHEFIPVVRVGLPPASVINLTLLALMVTGLALSLWNRNRTQLES